MQDLRVTTTNYKKPADFKKEKAFFLTFNNPHFFK